jgi:hypothetical protein
MEKIADQTEGLASITLDASEGIHVSYYTGDGLLWYANRKADQDWLVELIGQGVAERSIGIDSTGTIFIASIDQSNQLRIYQKPTGGIWQSSVIDTDAAGAPRMQVFNDQIHVVYWSNQNDSIKLALGAGQQAFSITDLIVWDGDYNIQEKRRIDFELQKNGLSSVVFVCKSNEQCFLSHQHQVDESTIEKAILESSADLEFHYPVLSIDQYNGIHVAYIYSEAEAFDLSYQYKPESGVWQKELLETGISNQPLSIIIDSTDLVVVSYSIALGDASKNRRLGDLFWADSIEEQNKVVYSASETFVDRMNQYHQLKSFDSDLYYMRLCVHSLY